MSSATRLRNIETMSALTKYDQINKRGEEEGFGEGIKKNESS